MEFEHCFCREPVKGDLLRWEHVRVMRGPEFNEAKFRAQIEAWGRQLPQLQCPLKFEDGRLVNVNADPDHPNGCICVKGSAAPEIVYAPERIRTPLVRSRPKGDPNPGWIEITWEQALTLVAIRLNDIKVEIRAQ